MCDAHLLCISLDKEWNWGMGVGGGGVGKGLLMQLKAAFGMKQGRGGVD